MVQYRKRSSDQERVAGDPWLEERFNAKKTVSRKPRKKKVPQQRDTKLVVEVAGLSLSSSSSSSSAAAAAAAAIADEEGVEKEQAAAGPAAKQKRAALKKKIATIPKQRKRSVRVVDPNDDEEGSASGGSGEVTAAITMVQLSEKDKEKEPSVRKVSNRHIKRQKQ